MYDFEVEPDEGDKYEVTATSRDILVFEKTTKGATLANLLGNPKMTDLYALAHIASRRQRMYTGTLSEFEKTCEVVFRETAEPDPTDREASTES